VPGTLASITKEEMECVVTNLRCYFLWAILYLALVFLLDQADHLSRPSINFASYFYLTAMIGVALTLFSSSVTRTPDTLPMAVWAGGCIALSLLINITHATTSNNPSEIVLGFLLLEMGIWVTHRLALQITHAELLMDKLASIPSGFRNKLVRLSNY